MNFLKEPEDKSHTASVKASAFCSSWASRSFCKNKTSYKYTTMNINFWRWCTTRNSKITFSECFLLWYYAISRVFLPTTCHRIRKLMRAWGKNGFKMNINAPKIEKKKNSDSELPFTIQVKYENEYRVYLTSLHSDMPTLHQRFHFTHCFCFTLIDCCI